METLRRLGRIERMKKSAWENDGEEAEKPKERPRTRGAVFGFYCCRGIDVPIGSVLRSCRRYQQPLDESQSQHQKGGEEKRW